LRPWRRVGSTRLHHCTVFDVDLTSFEPPGGGPAQPFYRIVAPDWITVVPLTNDGEVLLLRQYRFGIEGFTLEVPGGMCDPGESPLEAARRELREETGCTARELIELGWVHPNPALQANRCYSYLARGLSRVGPPEPDAHEAFEQISLPLAEVRERVLRGEISHALVVSAFHFLDLRALSSS
jgi:8-oxo-dGTP pyrophosphatase MutT (NUDIX family)